ncbi:MAG: SelT/SelW/SelH family protein [Dehalococcoidia bacterium]
MTDSKPRIAVTYCQKCHFLPRAAWVAQELLHTFGEFVAEVSLVPGEGGIFAVSIDGTEVWSTREMGRFPEMRELRGLVRDRIDGAPQPRHG